MRSFQIGCLMLVLLVGTATCHYHGWHRGRAESDSSHGSDSRSDSSDSSDSDESSEVHVHGSMHNHYGGRGGYHDKVWRFQMGVGGDFGPYDYIDPNTGLQKGFHVDLLNAICAEAGKKCNWIVDKYTNCWTEEDGQQLPGVGMLAGYYDGCLGYLATPERLNSLNFSTPYSENLAVGLYYRGGDLRGDALDVTGRRVGFVKGWFSSPSCLERQDGQFKGVQAGSFTPVMFDTSREMVQAMIDGSIEASWGFRAEYDPQSSNVQGVGPDVYCTSGGLSLMTRYSERALMDWWNEAFESMQRNGDFRQLCRRGRQQHGSRGELFCAL